MAIQIPLLSKPLPTTSGMTEEQFNTSMNLFINELDPFATAANAQAVETEENALKTQAAAGELENAVWVSGTTYIAGQVRYSPVDSLNYRRKTNGAGTTDPSADPVNWQLLTKTSVGGSDTTASAVDITLTSTSGRLQIISMTAPGKKVTAPVATTLNKGAPIFVIQNAGLYRFAFHKNGGAFVCYIKPGQIVALNCSDISNAAGIWQTSGQAVESIYSGVPELLNPLDSRSIAAAMMTPTKAICALRDNVTGFLNAIILNYGSASGAAVPINNESSAGISIAAQKNNQATVLYRTSSGVIKGYVLDNPFGDTITPGPVATIEGSTSGSFTSVAALSSNQLLCGYFASAPRERILDISINVITPSGVVTADATVATGDSIFRIEKISASKALYAFRGSSPKDIYIRLQSITGSTPAPTGVVLKVADLGIAAALDYGATVLNSGTAIVCQSFNGDLMISLIDISGVSPVLIRHKLVRIGLFSSTPAISSTRLNDNRVYVTWIGGSSLGVDGLVVTVTNDNDLIVGQISENLDVNITSAAGYLSCAALDSEHVMQVCRGSSTHLSAKTLSIPL